MDGLWFNHTGCLQHQDRDRDWDMDEWVVLFYVEPFTPHPNRDRAWYLLFPIVLVPVPFPVHVPDTASVITQLQAIPQYYCFFLSLISENE